MSERVFIVAIGAATSVGRSAWSTAAAVRAGISGFADHPYAIDSVGQPVRAAAAPWLEADLDPIERLEALVQPAIEEVLAPLRSPPATPARWAMALALPGPRPGLPQELTTAMSARTGRRWREVCARVATFPQGHAAGLQGTQAAVSKLRDGTLDACVVAGVDSWLDPETLDWLEATDQLHGAGPLNNAWGFVPGEAGAALLLMTEPAARAAGLPVLAEVLGASLAVESCRIRTETVCVGEGLTAALRGAFESLPAGARVTDVYCDMNGEPYRADEYGFAALRTGDRFAAASDFVAPADCCGDVGAASGPLHLALAVIASLKGYARGRLACVWSSAETGERAAAVLACAGPAPRYAHLAVGGA